MDRERVMEKRKLCLVNVPVSAALPAAHNYYLIFSFCQAEVRAWPEIGKVRQPLLEGVASAV